MTDEIRRSKQATLFHKLLTEARRALGLAKIYLDDGAPRDGANHLRRAAALYDEAADVRDKALGLTKQEPKT